MGKAKFFFILCFLAGLDSIGLESRVTWVSPHEFQTDSHSCKTAGAFSKMSYVGAMAETWPKKKPYSNRWATGNTWRAIKQDELPCTLKSSKFRNSFSPSQDRQILFPYVPQACCISLSLLSSLGQDSCSRDMLSSGPTSGHGDDTVMITVANLTDKRNSRWVHIHHESLKYLVLVFFFLEPSLSQRDSPRTVLARSQSSTASYDTREE